MLSETIARIESEHNIKKPHRSKIFQGMKIDGELSWTEYNILFRYSLRYNLPSMFDGIKKLIREEGAREQDENRDN